MGRFHDAGSQSCCQTGCVVKSAAVVGRYGAPVRPFTSVVTSLELKPMILQLIQGILPQANSAPAGLENRADVEVGHCCLQPCTLHRAICSPDLLPESWPI